MSNEDEVIAHEKADDFLDYVGLVLHQSAANYLDNYILTNQYLANKSNSTNKDYLLYSDFSKENPFFINDNHKSFTPFQEFINQNKTLPNALRGPPIA